MCGIAGFRDLAGKSRNFDEVASRMAYALAHRGPDHHAVWTDPTAGIALSHRRLSIIDTSSQGDQPMTSPSGRFVIVFNGEIYNFQILRRELEARADLVCAWRGHSDTEVMLAAFDTWGVDRAVERFVGMFAFAVWDRKDRSLYLVRDRMGEKPVYYGWANGIFMFGSELKALRAHPSFVVDISRDAIALQLRYSCIPAPYTIYRNIRKLEPGCIATLTQQRAAARQDPAISQYWSLRDVAARGISARVDLGDAEAVDQLDGLLRTAVSGQLVSDVPLGAFLSGGVDSSTVVALMQAQSGRPVKTYTIGFAESGFDEAPQAKAVAKHLGTDHTELYVAPKAAMDVIPRLPLLYDEPFSDSSQIPTALLATLARTGVTVSLSGDGGDELFGGYNRHVHGANLWRRVAAMPQFGKRSLATTIGAISPRVWELLYALTHHFLPQRLSVTSFTDKAQTLASAMRAESPDSFYLGIVSHWKEPANLVFGADEPPTLQRQPMYPDNLQDMTERMMWLDAMNYLPDDILVKVDRAAMAVSLESRVPLLDHRIVEWAWRLPLHMKVRHGQGKWLLRQVLYRYVPKDLIERAKMGFGVPLGAWLRGPLRPWAEDLLSVSRLRREGYFDPRPIRQKWSEHLAGRRNWQYHLWDVLMFQGWLRANNT